MRALVDVDGVLADFHAHTFDFVETELGAVSPDAHTSWDIIPALGRQYENAVLERWASEGWCRTIPVLEGAREGIAALREVADVYFVTAQMVHSPFWMWERMQWLKEHFAARDGHVVFTLSKYLVAGDVMVDDKPSNVDLWAKHHPTKKAILWDQPWNQDALGMRRARSWDDLLRKIRSG